VGLLVLQNTSPALSSLRGDPSIHNQIQPITQRGKRSYLGGSVIILFLLVGSYLHFHNPAPTPLTNDLGYFPVAIGEWKGHNTTPDYSEYKNLGVDHELSRIYETASGETIRLYIGYYEYQEQAKELINYKTKELHLNASQYKVAINKDAPVEINKVLLPSPKGSGSTLILFWYDLNGRIVADRYMAKAYTAWDAMIHRRTSGAVIMLTSEFDNRGGLDKALHTDEAFIRAIYPLLRDYLSHSPSPKETRSPSHLK
jgi:EpsI family protein